MIFSRSSGIERWQTFPLALSFVIIFFLGVIWLSDLSKECADEYIVSEEIMMLCKENQLGNGCLVDLYSWQMYPEGFVWMYF